MLTREDRNAGNSGAGPTSLPPRFDHRSSIKASRRGRLAAGFALVGGLVILPWLGLSEYSIGLLTLIFIYSSVNLNWSFTVGNAGILSFATMAFFSLGAYTTGVLNVHTGVSPWIGLLASLAVGALAGLALGIPSLRLYGPYIVLFTFTFHMLLMVLITTDTSGLTGGALGLTGVAPMKVPGLSDPLKAGYLLGLALCCLNLAIVGFVMRSPIGLALRALRDDERDAMSRGVSRTYHRLVVFVATSSLLALAGAFYASYYGYVSPAVLGFGLLLNLFAMFVVGGIGSRLGAVLGTALLVILGDQLQSLNEVRDIIWGTIVVLTLMWAPNGLAPVLVSLWEKVRDWLWKWLES